MVIYLQLQREAIIKYFSGGLSDQHCHPKLCLLGNFLILLAQITHFALHHYMSLHSVQSAFGFHFRESHVFLSAGLIVTSAPNFWRHEWQ